MLELAGSQLGQGGARYEGQNHVGWESLFQLFLNTESVGCVDENTRVLLRNDRLDDVCKIVYIWESLHAENDIVERNVLLGRVIWGLHNYRCLAAIRGPNYGRHTVAWLKPLIAEFIRPTLGSARG